MERTRCVQQFGRRQPKHTNNCVGAGDSVRQLRAWIVMQFRLWVRSSDPEPKIASLLRLAAIGPNPLRQHNCLYDWVVVVRSAEHTLSVPRVQPQPSHPPSPPEGFKIFVLCFALLVLCLKLVILCFTHAYTHIYIYIYIYIYICIYMCIDVCIYI